MEGVIILNRAGNYKSNLSGESEYKSFNPASLPPKPKIELDEAMLALLISANIEIAKLNEISNKIPHAPLFVSMYIRKEALLSSQIEGTQATLDDILDPEIEKNSNLDIFDVINYINATDYAMKRLETLPLCNRLILETHKILMRGVRGGEKSPGEFRKSQNWLGPAGSVIKNATYIPPNLNDMTQGMSDLEKFMNAKDNINPLIKIALVHYQFETIHPFLDGNGRIGRLLINLFLKERGLLKQPVLYTSYYFKKNRIEYYDRLNEVRLKGNYEQWVMFFLHAVEESAKDAINTIDSLTKLHDKNNEKISLLGKSAKRAAKLFSYLEKSPIIDIKKTSIELGVSFNTVASAIDDLVKAGILEKVGETKRSRRFAYEEYLKILRKDA